MIRVRIPYHTHPEVSAMPSRHDTKNEQEDAFSKLSFYRHAV
jgi:hypothetical protein